MSSACGCPTRRAAHDYRVRTRLRSVSVDWPVLRAPVTRVTGDFEIHNLEFRANSLRGVILDGPFEASVQPGPVGGDVSTTILVNGSGRAAGALLPAYIGLPRHSHEGHGRLAPQRPHRATRDGHIGLRASM